MNQSTNYNFNLPEGTDLVNLLTQLIPNWSDLDTILKGVENQAFTNCTEVTSLGVHAISRTNADGKILKWVATSNFTAGETFTVDGNVVAASTPAGATLATGAYVTGAIVIAALNSDESAMTIFVSGTNVATDSERLGGELPSYYATDSDMDIAKQAITDLDNLMGTTSISAIGDGTATGAISAINADLSDVSDWTELATSTTTSATDVALSESLSNFKEIAIAIGHDDAFISSINIISVDIFKTKCNSITARFVVNSSYGSNRYAYMYYIDNSTVKCGSSAAGITTRIYGIK